VASQIWNEQSASPPFCSVERDFGDEGRRSTEGSAIALETSDSQRFRTALHLTFIKASKNSESAILVEILTAEFHIESSRPGSCSENRLELVLIVGLCHENVSSAEAASHRPRENHASRPRLWQISISIETQRLTDQPRSATFQPRDSRCRLSLLSGALRGLL